MAARLRPHHQEDIKAKIQATKLLQLLQDEAIGKIPELSPGRRDSAKFLLNKSVSNAPTDIAASVDATITVEITRFADSDTQ